MWSPTTSSSTASSSDNKQNIKKEEVEAVEVDDCKCSGGEQQQKNNSKYPQQTSTFGAQFTDSTEQKKEEIDLPGETSDSGFISGPQTTSSINIDSEEQQTEVTGAVGVSGVGDIKKLNIPGSFSEPQLQKHHHQQHFKYQEKQQHQHNIDSGYLDVDSEQLQPKSQQQFDTDSGCIEEVGDMKFKHNVDAGLPEWFCNLSLQNSSNNANNNNLSRTNASNSSVSAAGLNNLGASRPQQQRLTQQKSFSSPSSYAAGQQTATVPTQITPANAWEKFYQQNDDGDTPLHLACISGYVDVVAALIRMAPHPCLFNIQNDEAQTPLHLATLTAQPKIIRMLLIAGAEPTVRDRHGNTALHLACISGEEQCVQALTIPISASEINEAHRQFGHRANDKSYLKFAHLPSDLEIRNYDGERCVHLAAQAGFIGILRILVIYGADINAREGKSGRTPLHIAIECCNEDLANFLLDECQKLNLETATYAGLTAYQVACILNKSEMQNMLEKKGAEPLTPPDSDYDSSDIETDLDDSKLYDRFGDPGYFVGYKGGNVMTVA